MNAATWSAVVVAAILGLIYQSYVSRRALQYPNSTNQQKVIQLALIWLLPLVGAAVVHGFFKLDAAPPRPRDPAFTTEVGHDGGSDVGH